LDFYSVSWLKQQSAGRHVAPVGHIILIPSQPVFALSPIDPWVLEFVVAKITGNNQWEKCNLLDFYFRGLSGPRNQRKLELHD
jgi:hypothetical protein